MVKNTLAPSRRALTPHGAGSRGRSANAFATAAFSAPGSAATGRVNATLASPGMHDSAHINQSAAARSCTVEPTASVAGGVI